MLPAREPASGENAGIPRSRSDSDEGDRVSVRPPMLSRHTRLRPLTPPDYDELYVLASSGEIPWQWHGLPASPENFRETLWSRTLVQFAISSRNGSDDFAGLVTAYGANLAFGTCYMQMLLSPGFRSLAWPIEGAVLFLNYLFQKYPLRKVYAEATTDTMPFFQSGEGSLGYTIEGHLRDHLFVNGRYVDLFILSISRDAWDRIAAAIVPLVLPR